MRLFLIEDEFLATWQLFTLFFYPWYSPPITGKHILLSIQLFRFFFYLRAENNSGSVRDEQLGAAERGSAYNTLTLNSAAAWFNHTALFTLCLCSSNTSTLSCPRFPSSPHLPSSPLTSPALPQLSHPHAAHMRPPSRPEVHGQTACLILSD